MKALILAAVTSALAGCAQSSDTRDTRPYDPMARSIYRDQLFNDCMKALPAGPQSTRYNDWAEVVDECDSNSFYRANERYRSEP